MTLRVLAVYSLTGERLLRYESRRDDGPPWQIRSISVPPGDPDADRLKSVDDADRLGRIDVLRCFLLDTTSEPWCYREVPGGHDRFPELTGPDEVSDFERRWHLDPDWHERQHVLLETFPEGEISGLQAAALAWLERDGRTDWTLEGVPWGLAVVRSGAAHALAEALVRIGYVDKTGEGGWEMSGALAAAPRLRKRLVELRAAPAEGKP